MSTARGEVFLSMICVLLGVASGSAHGQAPPASPPTSGGPAGASEPPPPPGAAVPAGSSSTPPPAAPGSASGAASSAAISGGARTGPDPVTAQAAARAKAAGKLLEAANVATVAGCRDLGEDYVETSLRGAYGRVAIRNELKTKAHARGASHVRYFGYAALDFNGQGEHGHFYDCAPVAVASAPSAPARASALPPLAGVGEDSSRRPAVAADVSSSAAARAIAPHALAFSGQLELLPVGMLKRSALGASSDADIATTFGVGATAEVFVTPYFALGLNPGVVLGLKGSAAVSATQFDARMRVRVGDLVSDGLAMWAYGTAGVSWISMPGDNPTADGAIFGFGAGVSHRVERSTFILFELGYQLGYQSASVMNVDVKNASQLFHLGLGIGRYL